MLDVLRYTSHPLLFGYDNDNIETLTKFQIELNYIFLNIIVIKLYWELSIFIQTKHWLYSYKSIIINSNLRRILLLLFILPLIPNLCNYKWQYFKWLDILCDPNSPPFIFTSDWQYKSIEKVSHRIKLYIFKYSK